MHGLRLALAGLVTTLAAAALPAGDPACPAGSPPVAWWAKPGRTDAYRGYYVGGGSACGGGPRFTDEGTWGWDYAGWCCPRKVFLRWTHGRLYQGGEGAYRVDGPPVPNFLAVP